MINHVVYLFSDSTATSVFVLTDDYGNADLIARMEAEVLVPTQEQRMYLL